MEALPVNSDVLDSRLPAACQIDATAQGSSADSKYSSFLRKVTENSASASSFSTLHKMNGPADAHSEQSSRQQSAATRHSTCEPVTTDPRAGGVGTAGGLTGEREGLSRQEVEKSLHALNEEERENSATIAALEHRRIALAKAAEQIQGVIEQSRESGQAEVMMAAQYQLQSIYQKQQETQAMEQQLDQTKKEAERRQLGAPSKQSSAQMHHEQAQNSISGNMADKQRTEMRPSSSQKKILVQGSSAAARGFSDDTHDAKKTQERRNTSHRRPSWKQRLVDLLNIPGPEITRESFLAAFYHPATGMSKSLLTSVFDQLKAQCRDARGSVTEHVPSPLILSILENHNGDDIVRLLDAVDLLEGNIRSLDKKCKNLAKSPLHEFTRRCTCRALLTLAKKAYAEMETTSQRFAPAVAVAGYSRTLEAYQYALTKSLAAEKNITLEQANALVSKCMHNMRNELETDIIQLRRMEIEAQAKAEEAKAAAAARARLQKMTPQEAEALGIPYSTVLQIAQSPEGVPVSGSASRSVSVPGTAGPAAQVSVTYRYPDGTLVTDPAHLPDGARAAELAAEMQIQKTATLAAEAAKRAEEFAVAQATSAAQAAVSAATFGGALIPPSLTSILPNAALSGDAGSETKDLQADQTGSAAGQMAGSQTARGLHAPAAQPSGMHLLMGHQQNGSYSAQVQNHLVTSEAEAVCSISPDTRRNVTGASPGMVPGMEVMRPQASPFPHGYPSQDSRMQSAHMRLEGQQLPAMTSQQEAMKGLREGMGASLAVLPAATTPRGQQLSHLPPNAVPTNSPPAGPAPLRPGLQTLSMSESRDMFRRTRAPAGSHNTGGGAPAASTRSMSLVNPLRQAGKLLAGAFGFWKEEEGENDEPSKEESKNQVALEAQPTPTQNETVAQIRQSECLTSRPLHGSLQHLNLPEMPQNLPVPTGAVYSGSPMTVASGPGTTPAGMSAALYCNTMPSTSTGVCLPRAPTSQMLPAETRAQSGAFCGETLHHEGFQSPHTPPTNTYSMTNVYQRPAASPVAAVLGRKQPERSHAAETGDAAMTTSPGLMERAAEVHLGAAPTQVSPFFGQPQAAPGATNSSSTSSAREDTQEYRIRVSSFQDVPRPQLGKQQVGNLQQVQAQLEQISIAHLEEYAKKFGVYSTPEEAAAALGGVPLQGVGALAGMPSIAQPGNPATVDAGFWGGMKADRAQLMGVMGGLDETALYQAAVRSETPGRAGQGVASAHREGEPMSQASQRALTLRQQYPGHGLN
uniref:Uncharacterized protein n=1 Tax=Toxoplasma gondii COUG TaxID=1074873 RepID=A0A2G8Y610_TOXGO|nr:hypothetical protein TGCOUG_243200 [Toxoplasma gondii COUG]